MSSRLFSLLPRDKWKLVECVTPAKAAILTSGNTYKFSNKDFWLLGRMTPPEDGREDAIQIGAQTVYYKDNQWWVVEKVKN
jgi:hypothetical protein